MKRGRGWLCLPPMLAGLVDLAVTLLGQPAAYWEGNLGAAREGAPHGMWLFHQHYLAFPLAFAGWIAIYCAAILLLPRGLARLTAVAVTIGHASAGNSWLSYHAGYWATIVADIVYGAVTVLALEKERRRLGDPPLPASLSARRNGL